MEIRAKNCDFSLGYGQYKSLLGQLYPPMASSHYEGVEKPSPFPGSYVLQPEAKLGFLGQCT